MTGTADDLKQNRRVFGRGVMAGLTLAGITNPREFMNATKARQAEQSLNGAARKVLAALPFDEAVSATSLVGRMKANGQNMDVAVVAGSLGSLKQHGLAREPTKERYIRVEIREAQPVVKPMPAAVPATPDEPEPSMEPLDRMARLAVRVRSMADEFRAIADEVEDVALGVEERIKAISGGAEKLAMLKKLLADG